MSCFISLVKLFNFKPQNMSKRKYKEKVKYTQVSKIQTFYITIQMIYTTREKNLLFCGHT